MQDRLAELSARLMSGLVGKVSLEGDGLLEMKGLAVGWGEILRVS